MEREKIEELRERGKEKEGKGKGKKEKKGERKRAGVSENVGGGPEVIGYDIAKEEGGSVEVGKQKDRQEINEWKPGDTDSPKGTGCGDSDGGDKRNISVDPDNTTTTTTSTPSSNKRKRSTLSEGELAIDISLPEPPSKKALRKLKKAPTIPTITSPIEQQQLQRQRQHHSIGATQNRSKHGVWIGNISFSTTESDLRKFLSQPGQRFNEEERKEDVPPPPGLLVGRINLPTRSVRNNITKKEEIQNKGFAYADFNIPEGVDWAVRYKSETYLLSRKVLIKDANDFDGRPSSSKTSTIITTIATTTAEDTGHVDGRGGGVSNKNPPSKILFVGNLPFETTDDEIREHFSFAGTILQVRLARFEDSGKCKGFGFLDFASTQDVERALKGVGMNEPVSGGVPLEGKEEVRMLRERKKTRRGRRIFKGRLVRMEFGENPEVRYKKRWNGKEGEGGGGGEVGRERKRIKDGGEKVEQGSLKPVMVEKSKDNERRINEGEKKVYGKGMDRNIINRMTGAMVQSTGKKVTFD